jgi:glycosyltransferase involved in cell wall biosynthesis
MARSRLNAICVVKDEDDIIAQTLTHAARYCDKIFVLDNGSTDETWKIVKSLEKQHSAIIPFGQTSVPWGDWLRSTIYNEVHHCLSDHDWWLILDSDEFLAEDPRPLIDRATNQAADVILAWQIQFYYTDADYESYLERGDSRSLPISERRRHYLINWQECRLFRNQSHRPWNTQVEEKIPDGLRRIYRRRIFNKHYQFRDPEQIQKRLNIRFGSSYFKAHVKTNDWHDVIRSSRTLNFHQPGDRWRFRPSGLFYHYRRQRLPEIRGKAVAALKKLRALVFKPQAL